jgi:class 3 adenylate cyclase
MTDPVSRSLVDDLLDRAIAALNRGEVEHAHDLAGQVLAAEADNIDAGDLLAAQVRPEGEIRRLTVMFCDLVGSTELSARLEPETYHSILVRYQRYCRAIIEDRYEGSVVAFRGDGILATFGFPVPHENDVDRAVRAGLDLLAGLEVLAAEVAEQHHEALAVRVAVHKGVVFLDREAGDLYGFAVNVAARLESLAEPGTLLISDEIQRLVGRRFELREHEPREVKGVSAPLITFTVIGESPVRAPGPADAPLVGRDAELAVLRAAWVAAQRRERPAGGCVAVIGEPGMGKSRLVAALAAEAKDARAPVVALIGSFFHTDAGLWPVRQLIEERCGITRHSDGPDRLRRLRDVVEAVGLASERVALLAALIGLGPEAGYEPPESDARRLREQIDEAACEFVDSCFGGDAAVLLCDDVQWFDDETLELVARFVRSANAQLAIVLATRDQSDVPRGERTTAVHLEPLDDQRRMELLRSLGGGDLPEVTLRSVAARSDGVPLYVEELLRAELQAPEDPGPAGPRPGRSAGDVPAVPDVLYEPLVARLHVSPNGATLAAAAATIGREVDGSTLARVVDLDPDDLRDALTALLGALILERAEPDHDRYRFRHELLRVAAYDLQTPSRRRELHGRVADALLQEAVDGDAVDWAVLATHFATAGRASDAADAFERAAEAARRRGALVEAQGLMTRAVDVVAADPQDLSEREVELRLRRGFLAVSLEGNSSATAAVDYERCLELSLGAVEGDSMFGTINALWSHYCSKGELDRADELLEVLNRSSKRGGLATRFISATARSVVSMYRGDYLTGLRAAEESVALSVAFDSADEYGRWWFVPLDPAVSSHFFLAAHRIMTGDLPGGSPQITAAHTVAAALPFPQGAFSLAGCLSFEVWLNAELGLLDEAEGALAQLVEISERHGFDQWSIVGITQREVVSGYRLLAGEPTGDGRAALSRHAAALGSYLAMWKLVEQWVFVPYYTTVQAAFHAAAGEIDAAEAALRESLAIAERTGMRFHDVETLRQLAHLRPDPAAQAAGLHDALALSRAQGTRIYELRAADDLRGLTGDVEPLRSAVAGFAPGTSYPGLDAARVAISDP